MLPPRSRAASGRLCSMRRFSIRSSAMTTTSFPTSTGTHAAQGCHGGPHDGDRSADAQRRAEHYQRRRMTDVTQDTYQLAAAGFETACPFADPDRTCPQPREDRMASTWRLAKPARIAAALQTAQSRNLGGWFVAGASGDVGRKESVTRTTRAARWSSGETQAGRWSPGRARARTSGRCWTNARLWTARCIADGTASH